MHLLPNSYCWAPPPLRWVLQVAEKMGDAVRILKIDTDQNPDISTQLQVRRVGAPRGAC